MDKTNSDKHLEKTILEFESRFCICFNDKRLLQGALDHTESNSERKKKYALAGDALLDFILFNYLINKQEYSKGKMDCIRQNLNTDSNLASLGKEMGLKLFILFPDSVTELEKETASAYYNDTLEALVYVIMRDQGLDKAIGFVLEHIFSKIPKKMYDCKN